MLQSRQNLDPLPTVLCGSDALSLTLDPRFAAEWLALYDACPWATVGQHPAYVAAHWRNYHDLREPVLIFQRDDAGTLLGLLTLYRDGHALVGGGGDDCEYHVWLSSAAHASAFMTAAVKALRAKIGSYELSLEYLPPDVPLEWTVEDSTVGGWCEVIPVERRIIRTKPGVDVLANFQGKTRLKRKAAKLAEEGRLEFRVVTDSNDFDQVLDQFVPLFDFRKGALYGAFAFRDFPRRRKVLRDLFDVPGLLCVCALELDGKVLAAHVGVAGRRETFTFGGSAHDEFYGRSSPGVILQMHLFRSAHQRGYAIIDLTPGDDPYKTHWANDKQVAYRLHVRSSTLGQGVSLVRRAMRASVRSVLSHLPAADDAHDAPAPTLMVPLYDVKQVFSSGTTPTTAAPWRRDSTADLLAHPARGGDYWKFLQWVLSYIRDGATSYTRTIDGVLTDGWLLTSVENTLGAYDAPSRPPADGLLLIEITTRQPSVRVGLSQSLPAVLAEMDSDMRRRVFVVGSASPDRLAGSGGLGTTPLRIPMTADGRIAAPAPANPIQPTPAPPKAATRKTAFGV